ncbi:hypothetical protein YC2023_037293 [Brassica napus]
MMNSTEDKDFTMKLFLNTWIDRWFCMYDILDGHALSSADDHNECLCLKYFETPRCSFNRLLVNWDEFSWLAGPCSPKIPSEQMEKVRIWLAKRRIMAEISTRKSIIKLSRSFADMVNQWLLLFDEVVSNEDLLTSIPNTENRVGEVLSNPLESVPQEKGATMVSQKKNDRESCADLFHHLMGGVKEFHAVPGLNSLGSFLLIHAIQYTAHINNMVADYEAALTKKEDGLERANEIV